MTARLRVCGIAAVPLLLTTLALTAQPTPTSAGRPRLSGGFGRPRLTPTPTPARRAGDPTRQGDKAPRSTEKSKLSITNDNLVTDPSKGKLTTTSRTGAAAPAPAKTPVSGTPSRTVAPEVPFGDPGSVFDAQSAEETKWRAAARIARERVETLKQRIADYEREAAKLESDFYAWDDGQYRDGVIKPAWDRKKDELEQARKDLAEAEKDLADLPEKARKAGALPGWIRE